MKDFGFNFYNQFLFVIQICFESNSLALSNFEFTIQNNENKIFFYAIKCVSLKEIYV